MRGRQREQKKTTLRKARRVGVKDNGIKVRLSFKLLANLSKQF